MCCERVKTHSILCVGCVSTSDVQRQNGWSTIFRSPVLFLAGTGCLWHYQAENTVAPLH